MPTTPEGSKRDDLTKFLPGEGIDSIILGEALRLTEESEESILAFAADIAKNGQNEPGMYRLDNQRRPHLIFGHRRLRAIRDYINPDPGRFGLPGPMVFKAKYRDMTEAEALAVTASENLQRRDLKALDRAYIASRFIGVLGWEKEQVAATLQVKVPQVGRLLDLLRLPAAVIDRLKRDEIKESTARSFAGLDDEQVGEHLAALDRGEKPARVARDAKKSAGKRIGLTRAEILTILDALECDQAERLAACFRGKCGIDEARLGDFPPVEVGTASDTEPRIFICADCLTEALTVGACESCESERVVSKAALLATIDARPAPPMRRFEPESDEVAA